MSEFKMTVNGRELPLNEDEQACAKKLQMFGCCCCLCTLCLSWIPLCCYCSKMDKKYSAQVYATSADANTALNTKAAPEYSNPDTPQANDAA